MKKFITAALLCCTVIASAQQKSADALRSAVTKAEAAAENPKKAVVPATWMKIGKAYMDAYNAPSGQLWLGASLNEIQLVAGGQAPLSQENVVLSGAQYIKQVYPDKNLYFSANGQLQIIEVTAPVYEDALACALKAYAKAAEVDVKQSKKKELDAALQDIAQKYLSEGLNEYTFGRLGNSSVKFEKAAEASATAPLCVIDTTALYNAGFTAWMDATADTDSLSAIAKFDRARVFFEKCAENNYFYEDGEVYAKLHDIYRHLGETEKARDVIETGFSSFPQSQSILISLINFYIENKENPEKLFALLDVAIQNEPNNASLYYVKGNIYNELADKTEDEDAKAALKAKALESYYKCAEINPSYEFGFIGAGVMFYNDAVVLSEKASNEYDDRKYEALVKQFEQYLKDAIDPFEKAFAVTKSADIKNSVALYLKNIYYRFSSQSDEYLALYKKYDEIVKAAQ
ncbi:MAG: tetratricopeptide repeat protein [Candidatus Cryptobacteroides sp.]